MKLNAGDATKAQQRTRPIQTPPPDVQDDNTVGAGAALRLVALVLTWALLLLPPSLEGPLPEHRDWHASAIVADIGNPFPVLSNFDRNQTALRSSEIKQSVKSCGGLGKAVLAGTAQQVLQEAERCSPASSAQAVASKPRFAAFSARAPPRRV